MAGGLAEKETTGTTVVTGDKLPDLTGEVLRTKIVEEYGEGAVLEVEKAYPGETGNWGGMMTGVIICICMRHQTRQKECLRGRQRVI